MKKLRVAYLVYLVIMIPLLVVTVQYTKRKIANAEAQVQAVSEGLNALERAAAPAAQLPPAPTPTVPAPAEPVKAEPASPQIAEVPPPPTPQFVVPADARELSPMNGWVDQPDKSKPGRLHMNIRAQWANGKSTRRPASYGGDCWKTTTRPPERLTIPGGTVDILTPRRITTPCR
ncbi:MAG: hypothetical protein IT406_03150 [Candidatus Yanofskybacteria bacterium]|nr:hypothetical protein [Candidatus Yanofskybacteria bacterium]